MAERDKLFEPRNVQDEARDSEIISKIRVLEHLLSSNPQYVGLEIGGSLYKGYADLHEGSDVDFAILIDKRRDSESSGVWELQQQFVAQNPQFHYLGTVDLAGAIFKPGEIEGAEIKLLLSIVGKVSGRLIDQYRRDAREWLKGLDTEKRKYVLSQVRALLEGFESSAMKKLVFRRLHSEYGDDVLAWERDGYNVDADDVLNARDGLWMSINTLAKDKKFSSAVAVEVKRRMQLWHARLEKILGYSV